MLCQSGKTSKKSNLGIVSSQFYQPQENTDQVRNANNDLKINLGKTRSS